MILTKKIILLLLAILLMAVAAMQVSQRFRLEIAQNVNLSPEKSWVGQYLAGFHAAKNRDYEKASDYFSGTLSGNNANEYLQSKAMTLLLVSGKFSEAFQIADMMQENDESTIAGLTLVTAAIEKGNFKQADEILTKLKSKDQYTIIHKILHAWVKLGMGNELSAQAMMETLEKEQAIRPFVDYHYALIAEIAGNDKKAEQLYNELIKGDKLPTSIAANAHRFFKARNDETKMKLIERKLEGFSRIENYHEIKNVKQGAAEAFLGIGGIIMTEYHSDRAAAFFRLAIYLHPGLDEAKMLLGSILINEGDYKSANNILRQISTKSTLGDYAKLTIARNFEAMDENAKARQYFENLISSEETKLEAMISLGDLARKEESYSQAIDYYTQGLQELDSRKSSENTSKYWPIYFARGVSYERLQNWEAAEKDLKKALSLQPNQPDILNYLAYTWLDMGINLEDAKEMIIEAHQQRPDDSHITDSVGWAWYRLGEYAKAVEYLEEAATQMPYDATVNDHLGDVYWKLGRKNEAKFQWQRALDSDPDAEQKQKLELKLEQGLLEVANQNSTPAADNVTSEN
ncbi:MAG: hypothetical protein COV36_08135 [Alphaproteobacteria bacterium CG11_big_fil_rev_8_21_14_0_20_44_7]|nr:MAG: hypothetical protein COV36_08135 [Alphaproteobacteria bacterium CG11_big_fil_rev_8_21_14_0_20_44_7]